ncbi:hypothetical protein ACQKL5_18475 [Peribacillus sp. NPDC097675]|uniref:hypothetical protein n=1 Tax=Peribacillus sp. NPDC097675 TaxID=3390618 RepID=UPI003D07009D
MNTWKDAFWIAKIEWRKSWFKILCLFLFLSFLAVLRPTIWEGKEQVPPLFTDVFFLLIFGCVAFIVRAKDLQVQRVDEEIWVSPFFMMLNMLPIKKDVLVKSRFIHMLFPSLPFQILFLVLFSPRYLESMAVMEYVVFSIIWLAFGISSSFIFAASDAGDRYTQIKLSIYSVAFYGGVTIGLVWLTKKTGMGIVGWTTIAAKNFPIWSILISAAVTVGHYYFSKYYMKKKMIQIDYLK